MAQACGERAAVADRQRRRRLQRAVRWRKRVDEDAYATIEDLARAKGVHATYVRRVLRLTLLGPEVVEAILDGRQAEEFRLEELLEGVPLIWDDQHTHFG